MLSWLFIEKTPLLPCILIKFIHSFFFFFFFLIRIDWKLIPASSKQQNRTQQIFFSICPTLTLICRFNNSIGVDNFFSLPRFFFLHVVSYVYSVHRHTNTQQNTHISWNIICKLRWSLKNGFMKKKATTTTTQGRNSKDGRRKKFCVHTYMMMTVVVVVVAQELPLEFFL